MKSTSYGTRRHGCMLGLWSLSENASLRYCLSTVAILLCCLTRARLRRRRALCLAESRRVLPSCLSLFVPVITAFVSFSEKTMSEISSTMRRLTGPFSFVSTIELEDRIFRISLVTSNLKFFFGRPPFLWNATDSEISPTFSRSKLMSLRKSRPGKWISAYVMGSVFGNPLGSNCKVHTFSSVLESAI